MKTIFWGRHLIFAVYAWPNPTFAYNSHKSPPAFLQIILLGIQLLALANTSHASLTSVNCMNSYSRSTEMSKIKHIYNTRQKPKEKTAWTHAAARSHLSILHRDILLPLHQTFNSFYLTYLF